jgi:hypothetical protein
MKNEFTMSNTAPPVAIDHPVAHRVDVRVTPAITGRNRLTCAFRVILAIPHILLVGGPAAIAMTLLPRAQNGGIEWGSGTGVLGAVAAVAAIIAWFAIVFTGTHPEGLWKLSAFYLRWRVRAAAYLALLSDEYPPFEDGPYPATLVLTQPDRPRDRVATAFRIVLALPHIVLVWLLGFAWAVTTVIAWFSILLTGNYPPTLYRFGVGVLRWSTRLEAYLLLLHDDYPPFSLD